MLEVDAEGVYTMVYVLKGMPVFAEEGSLGETLGRLLLREGVLSQEQYGRIIEHMTSSVIGAEQMRFGEVAVALGFATGDQVNEALAKQVRRKILRCLESEAATCVFREGEEELRGITRYPSPIPPLVLRAVTTSFAEERVSRMLEGAASAYPQLCEEPAEIGGRFKMDPAQTAFLEEIDGTRTSFDLIFTSPLGGLHASQLLAVLIVAEQVRLLDEPVRQPEPSAPPDSSPAVVGRVALRQVLARRMAPTEAAPPSSRTAASAPPKTPHVPRSVPPASSAAKLRAEKLFQSGKLHVRHERWPLAVKDLQEASRLFPSAVEYQLYLAWAEFQTHQDSAQAGQRRAHLEELAMQALRQDRQMAFGHHVIGQVKLMQGDEKGAARSFRLASKLDSNDKVAARYFRMLARKLGG